MKPVHIDGFLFFTGSFFGSISAGFASDAAYQYVNSHHVFWIRIFSAAISTSCISLITFRNQTYAKWISNKGPNEATTTVDIHKVSVDPVPKPSIDNPPVPAKDVALTEPTKSP